MLRRVPGRRRGDFVGKRRRRAARSCSACPSGARKLYEDVALGIERMIRERRYLPGDRLPSEKEIMSEFGVGRLAVREAMLSLQKMGLVR